MRYFVFLFLSAVLFSVVPAQTREEAINELNKLKQKAGSLEEIILSPNKSDYEAASRENAQVFRILPRETYDKGLFKIRGGGAFYSFYRKTHEYGQGSDISLEQGNFGVGFAGADYGFIADLGDIPLSEINKTTKGVAYLSGYIPPTDEADAREENKKGWRPGFEVDGVTYLNRVPAAAGHTYVIRSVNLDRSDVLVAFRVYRKDADRSYIIFWKLLEQFEKPILNRSNETSQKQSGNGLEQRVLNALRNKGFYDVTVDVSTIPLTLRGTVPKGKLANAIMTAMEEIGGNPVKNEINEK